MRYFLVLLTSFVFVFSNAQVKIEKITRKYIDFYYEGRSSDTACYFDPYFSLEHRKGNTVKIRYDRMDELGDTLILYLNDTTILKNLAVRNDTDEFKRRVDPDRVEKISLNEVRRMRVYFRRPRTYRRIVIYYSFSNNCPNLVTFMISKQN
jgi:hypothetical protein